MNLFLGLAVAAGFFTFVMTVFRDISIGMIINLDAFLIVAGGTVLAVLVGFPFSRIKDTLNDVMDTFRDPRDREGVIADIVDVSRLFGRVDIRTIENRMRDIDDVFLKRAVNLLINRNDNQTIQHVLEREMVIRKINFNFSQNLLKTVARLTPSFGLAGTVISLIRMFNNFRSIDEIAPLMAIALMSTLYGVIISNLIVLPLGAKLKERAIMTETLMNITIEGVLAINDMVHPLKIEERLGGYQWTDDTVELPAGSELAAARSGNVY